MKAKQLQIPNPCSENWTLMDKSPGGKYCRTCSQVVKDFSRMTDTQILYVLSSADTKICGQFRKDQLNRSITMDRNRRVPDLLAVVLGITVLLSAYPAYSGVPVYETPEISLISMLGEDTTKVEDNDEYIEIEFEIVSKDSHEPIPFAKVIVKGKFGEFYAGALTDSDGIGLLKLTTDQLDLAMILEISSLDFENKVLNWNRDWHHKKRYQIELEDGLMLMGDVYILPEKKAKRKQKREARKQKL